MPVGEDILRDIWLLNIMLVYFFISAAPCGQYTAPDLAGYR